MIQGTQEWFQIRAGKVTASRVADILAKTKSGYAASRANYMAQLVTERLTGQPGETFTNAAMVWGSEMEPEARRAYEFYKDVGVEEIAFVTHPSIAEAGASPDGLVGQDGLVEIKAPQSATHIDTLLKKAVPGKYVTQMMWQMACTGRAWVDFVSYDPRMPESMQFFCTRVMRDEALIQSLETQVKEFLAEVDQTVRELRALYEREAA